SPEDRGRHRQGLFHSCRLDSDLVCPFRENAEWHSVYLEGVCRRWSQRPNACFVRSEGRARSTVTGDLLDPISDHTDRPRWIQLLPQGPIQMKYVASQLIGGVIEFWEW
ncbi:MAG TPA: hypothetical protein VF396_26765, partial [Bradyrhizobium sp.]